MSAIIPLKRYFSILFILACIIILLVCYQMDYFSFHRRTPDWISQDPSFSPPLEKEDGESAKQDNETSFLPHKELNKEHISRLGLQENEVRRQSSFSVSFVPKRSRPSPPKPTLTAESVVQRPVKSDKDIGTSDGGSTILPTSHRESSSTVRPPGSVGHSQTPIFDTSQRQPKSSVYMHSSSSRIEKLPRDHKGTSSVTELRSSSRTSIANNHPSSIRNHPIVLKSIILPNLATQRTSKPASEAIVSSRTSSTSLSDQNTPNVDKTSLKLRPLLEQLNNQKTKTTPTPRPRSCEACMKHEFPIMIQPPPCNSTRPPDILFMVISSPAKAEMRNAIRNSWGKSRNGQVKLVFLFGKPKESSFSSVLQNEAKTHHDILQEDFTDSYGNLTYKTMMAFKFVRNFCPSAKYVFKTDDDMWINVGGFLRAVKLIDMGNSIGGMCILDAAPIRDTRSKWYASYLNYPENKYPGFCSGTAYFMEARVAIQIYDVSPDVPFFYLEDVYVSLCAERVGVRLQPVSGFNNYRVRVWDWCSYVTGSLITSHGVTSDELRKLANLKCD